MNTQPIITPDQLEADATVPQCLDNQYVPNEVFDAMTAPALSNQETLNYIQPEIDSARTRHAQTEFRRSLVYSTQVIINRAFLVNSPVLFSNYLPGHVGDINAYAKLLCPSCGVQAIVPYLHKANFLSEPLPHEEDQRGRLALNSLLDKTGDNIVSVRLHRDQDENIRQVEKLETVFGSYFSGTLKYILDPGREMTVNEMAAELFGPSSSHLQEGDTWNRFHKSLLAVTACAFNHSASFNRTHVYKEFLVPGENDEEQRRNVVTGKFRKPRGDDEFIFEIKKLIDLVYNTNLPDRLGCYTFTPVGLPSRMALQDFAAGGASPSVGDIETLLKSSTEFRAESHRIFMSNAHQGMALPLLSDLSIPDLVEIRNLDAWAAFSQAQQAVLREPLGILNKIGDFTQKFNNFQAELSNWYFHKYKLRNCAERYANFATIALQIGGRILIALGFPGEDAASVAHAEITEGILDHAIANRTKGFMVNLMVYVVDLAHDRIDPDRSYSIELMRANNEYTCEQVQDLARQFFPNLEQGEHVIDDTWAHQLSMQGAKQN